MSDNNLGIFLKDQREKLNLSQQAMSNQLGMSMSGYQKYEQGKRKPKVEVLKEISKVLKVNVNDLMKFY